ncbi:MAG: peptidoglycan bridge formation glycyltransferase FemA/FemB family protein [Firmicutes bacterium]|nr:peptidoglycan bridge formation glycyltransferase FemA/FemB family protein [Bacillota bacterium]
MRDIYFEKDYGILHERVEGGTCEVFEYGSSTGNIRHMFIRREIPINIGDTIYYDLITPYDYGGPVIEACRAGEKGKLIEEFEEAFGDYCWQNHIVSEFVRFHPLVENARDFERCYQVAHSRNTVGTNLKHYKDPFMEEFSKSARKSIRRAFRAGVEFEVIEGPIDLGDFRRIYYSTMDRKRAPDFYYFGDEYFENCLRFFRENIALVEATYQGKTVASGLYFTYNDMIHAHLSGTLADYLHLSPAYVLKYAITLWGKKRGYALIHHGGGITKSKNDSLYRFKQKFGKNTGFQFHTGRKVWNKEIYRRLCLAKGVGEDRGFFPAYRA